MDKRNKMPETTFYINAYGEGVSDTGERAGV